MSTRWRKYWLLVFWQPIFVSREQIPSSHRSILLVLLLVFKILVLGVGLSSTDQCMTKLSRGKHCPLCKMRGPRWETCGGEGAVVSWFFDDQFVNGCRTEHRRSLLFFHVPSITRHFGKSDDELSWWLERTIRSWRQSCPIVAQNRRNEVSRWCTRAEPLCKSSIRRSVEELAQIQPYHHRVNQSIRLSSIQCFSLAENRIFFESYVDVDGDDGTGSGW